MDWEKNVTFQRLLKHGSALKLTHLAASGLRSWPPGPHHRAAQGMAVGSPQTKRARERENPPGSSLFIT